MSDRQVKPLHCPNPACGRTLGTTDGDRLYLGVTMLCRSVTLYCIRPTCQGRIVWHPTVSRDRNAQTTRY